MMYNNREAILDGTQLAADWTFSGLQKFGQGLLDKLRGLKLPHPLLEKVNNIIIFRLYYIIANGHADLCCEAISPSSKLI